MVVVVGTDGRREDRVNDGRLLLLYGRKEDRVNDGRLLLLYGRREGGSCE